MTDDTEERYPGEHDALSQFLGSLEPYVDDVVGRDNLLAHAVHRAVISRKLAHLRHARDLFNAQPRGTRDALSDHCIETNDGKLSDLIVDDDDVLETTIIRFESSAEEAGIQIRRHFGEMRNGEPLPADIAVDIQPGTLPSYAADRLRVIAGNIEANKQLLSDRYWQKSSEPAKPGQRRPK